MRQTGRIRWIVGRWLSLVPAEAVAAEREQLLKTASEWRARHDEMARGRISVTPEPPMRTAIHVRVEVADVISPLERKHLLELVVETIKRQARW